MPRARPEDWDQFIRMSEAANEDDWVAEILLPVARLAAQDPDLAKFFPIRSHNRLCFSRRAEAPTNPASPAAGTAP